MIRIADEPFEPGAELDRFARGDHGVGGVASFIGRVRSTGTSPIVSLTLEHYPGMTERLLTAIEEEARRRWQLLDSLVVHRVGRMGPGEPIVLVATAAAHRGAALEACAFLIDWLKTKAPFWKLETTAEGERWVEARAGDDAAAARWHEG